MFANIVSPPTLGFSMQKSVVALAGRIVYERSVCQFCPALKVGDGLPLVRLFVCRWCACS